MCENIKKLFISDNRKYSISKKTNKKNFFLTLEIRTLDIKWDGGSKNIDRHLTGKYIGEVQWFR